MTSESACGAADDVQRQIDGDDGDAEAMLEEHKEAKICYEGDKGEMNVVPSTFSFLMGNTRFTSC